MVPAVSRYDAELGRTIDERIAAALPSPGRRMGTLVTRDSTGAACTVRFDGSTVTTPAKVFSHVGAVPGDRVGLQQFGSEWVIVGGFTA